MGLRKSGIRGIVTIHDLIFMRHPEYYHWLDTKIYEWKFRQSLREADHIIAISERRLGGRVRCFMADEDVLSEAKARGITRAAVSMERAARIDKPCIFAIGNAPTALIKICELCGEGRLSPALVIGVPVGFVNVVESKELLIASDIPHIAARGRKGGSGVAAAVVNALIYEIMR